MSLYVRTVKTESVRQRQSEKLLRLLFAHAEKQSSAIIFFDEIDSIAAQRDDNAHEAGLKWPLGHRTGEISQYVHRLNTLAAVSRPARLLDAGLAPSGGCRYQLTDRPVIPLSANGTTLAQRDDRRSPSPRPPPGATPMSSTGSGGSTPQAGSWTVRSSALWAGAATTGSP